MKKQQIISGLVSGFALLLSTSVMADSLDKREQQTYRESNHQTHKSSVHRRYKESSGFSKLKRMANSMGGLEKIMALQAMQFMAKGSRFEPEQSNRPGGEFVRLVDYDYNLINAFAKPLSRTEWLNDVKYPFIEQRQYTEIINAEHGAVFGFDTFIAPSQEPMLSTRIGSRSKQNLVSSPLALIHRASRFPDKVRFIGIEKYNDQPHQVISIPGWGQPIYLYINVASKLPSKAETLEDDSVYGDTRWEVIFSDWTEVSDIKVPATLTHKINGRTINKEMRDSFNLNVELNPELFAIPDELLADFNPDQFAWGVRSSQWFNRFLPAGIPFDLDQRTAATFQIVEVAPKIYHARALTHHSMIIEMNDYLIVAEAPLYDELTQVVLSAIKERWPNKPVKYVIATHFHNDHIGGIRGYGAVGATLIVGKGTKEHYEEIFDAPHTVYPDAYSRQENDVKIKTVEAGEELVLTDGTRRVRIFDVANRHAIGTIVPFVEDANLMFVSDLYNPEFFTTTIPQRFLSWSVDLLAALESTELEINTIVGGHGGISSYAEFVSQVKSSL